MTYDLERYLYEQDLYFDTAREELLSGRKRGHWMWYIFPQIAGLGETAISRHYAIRDIGEARAFLANDTLRRNLTELCTILLIIAQDDPSEVFSYPDDLKLRSSMTLFEAADPTLTVFGEVLDKFYGGVRDARTLEILQRQENNA